MKSDAIELRGIHCYGYHGRHPEERRLGQRFTVDLDLRLDLSPAGVNDDLERGVDYSAVIRLARSIVEGESYELIETVAERLAQAILRDFSAVIDISVSVHKPNAPVAGAPVDDIAVRIHRARKGR